MEGEALKKLTRAFSRLIIETRDDNRVLRFSNFMGRRSESGLRVTARDGFFVPPPAAASGASIAEVDSALQL
jgi:hypothetical protein